MVNIINKIYVINLDERPDRWRNINLDFIGTGLKLNRWKGMYGKHLSDDKVNNNTSKLCSIFCTPSMIGIWLSHYNLWQHIVKHKENNVLILEDDVVPIKDFTNKLKSYWKEIPKDWDMIYLGCHGSCDKDSLINGVLSTTFNRYNKNVYKNKKLSKHIIKPSFPVGFYAYMLSYKGAKKLINHPYFKKAKYHIDWSVAMQMMDNNNFKAYAITPPLIYPDFDNNKSDNMVVSHKLFEQLFSRIPVSQQLDLQTLLNLSCLYYRPLSISINCFTILLSIIALIIGLFVNKHIKTFAIFLIFFQLLEIAYTKSQKDKIKMLIFEYIISILFLTIGYRIHIYLNK